MKNRTHPSEVESLEVTDAHNQRTAFILKSRTDKGCMSHLSGAVESPSQGLLNKLTILMKKMFHYSKVLDTSSIVCEKWLWG